MVSHIAMTRARLYVLIDAFEADMRQILDSYILDHLEEEEAVGNSFDRASQRRADDPLGDNTSITAFLDLQECYDILNKNRDSLPADVGRELKDNTIAVNSMVPVRNRVMHGRPLVVGDPETALSACRAFVTRYWSRVKEVIRQLEVDSAWQPVIKEQDRTADRVLHNLPLPEYDETGLIGRSDLSKDVKRRLMRRREPIVTLVGEGGIGKTALALDVAYQLVEDPECPYECILWVSLKTERLTASGVVSIAGAVRDLTGAAGLLGGALDSSFTGGVKELAEAIEGIPTLLIVDNLETVTGDEVSTLYDSLPDSVNFLFTSRVGIGQLERRVTVGPLAGKDANFLFRNFAKARGVQRLARSQERTISDTVKRLRSSPLAIRWYIMAVEAGQQPNLALADQSVLLDFCIRSVYDKMSQEARQILAMLYALDRVVLFDELAILADTPVDSLRGSVQQLLRGSMVVEETDGSDPLISRITLTESARNFLRAVSPPQSTLVESTLRREREFRRSDERRRADAKSRQLAPNVVRVRGSADVPVAHLLREALSASKRDSFKVATEITARARSLNPEYWEVDRVEAFIFSAAGYVDKATAMYRNALRNARNAGDEEGIAVVSYFFSGHLSRRANEPEQALDYANDAHKHFNSPETGQELGKLLFWLGRFEESQHLLEDAIEKSAGRTRLIAMTALVDSWKRWSEELLSNQRRPMEALDKAYTGFHIGMREISLGTYDKRLCDGVLDAATQVLRSAESQLIEPKFANSRIDGMLKSIDGKKAMFATLRGYRPFSHSLLNLSKRRNLPAYAQVLLGVDSKVPGLTQEGDPHTGIAIGQVRGWRGTYGFITHVSYPDDVFFPASAVKNLRERGEDVDLVGYSVRFTAQAGDGPRPKANHVEIMW
ncbi:NB-ARC domain-containing protein [Amycolatopsis sp. NPDC051903]|uniref:NB-ARC domain-containing protein n=1 Tax=Amycolatopsis sp. NPDC051903 TaxID=3363936 RepID=UPI0037A0314A